MLKTNSIRLSALVFVLFACNPAVEESSPQILLKNQSSIDLKDKGVIIDFKDLKSEANKFLHIADAEGNSVAYQIDDVNGDGIPDQLFMLVDLKADEEKSLDITWVDSQPKFEQRTAVRFGKRDDIDQPVTPRQEDLFFSHELPKSMGYQPYQTDGPSWENDKVGFRHYFDGRNSKDLFGKKTSKMSPKDVGVNDKGEVEDNYHVMEDWGRDILAVGNSVGLGGITLLKDDQPARLGVLVDEEMSNIYQSSFKIMAEGPIRSIMEFEYRDWDAFDRKYPRIVERVSIVPGMYAYKNEVMFEGLHGDEHLAVGLVNIHNDKGIKEITDFDDWVILMTHDAQGYDKEWIIGMALILPKGQYMEMIEAPKSGKLTDSYLAKMKSESEKTIEYYAVGAWELSEDRFMEAAGFERYLRDLVAHLEAEVSVSIQ
ncbi:DUF4861 domain-containing protein [Belliella sp. DSM 111904]|uniref:DUF4861 domain-containing protein n=1 Tax=Belliella filtrata TaxID=2923435 RepID=A0ABS9UYV7_9BACT|nr:DUF4861 domain-containing protein [Belliella filtrata]MCH7409351.1 DUF4861 domain-containing protein [Belliella filtrata]